MDKITEKQFWLTGLLEYLLKKELPIIVKIITPANVKERGSQLSLEFDRDLKQVHQQLEEQDVIVSLSNDLKYIILITKYIFSV